MMKHRIGLNIAEIITVKQALLHGLRNNFLSPEDRQITDNLLKSYSEKYMKYISWKRTPTKKTMITIYNSMELYLLYTLSNKLVFSKCIYHTPKYWAYKGGKTECNPSPSYCPHAVENKDLGYQACTRIIAKHLAERFKMYYIKWYGEMEESK